MKPVLTALLLLLLVAGLSLPAVASEQIAPAAVAEQTDPVEKKLQADFPSLVYREIKPTPVEKMYEVIAAGQIFYYFPDSAHILLGDLVDIKTHTNLTVVAKEELQVKLLSELPLDKAIKIGHGPKQVIEVTDPDCPYCRTASQFFEGKDELVTRYVFFFPLMEIHPDAAIKAAFVLSSEDRAAAYHDVMAGKYDTAPLPEFEDNRLLEEHRNLTGELGVRSTPQFWIDGENVQGANIEELEMLIAVPKGE